MGNYSLVAGTVVMSWHHGNLCHEELKVRWAWGTAIAPGAMRWGGLCFQHQCTQQPRWGLRMFSPSVGALFLP